MRTMRWQALVTGAFVLALNLTGCGDGQSLRATNGTTAPTSPTTSALRRPAVPRMPQVRRFMRAQEFRTYTGPRLPPISATAATARVCRITLRKCTARNLGLHDVGEVHDSGARHWVVWHHVWIVASTWFVKDIHAMELGYRGPPRPPAPGWGRGATMIDATSGRFVMGVTF